MRWRGHVKILSSNKVCMYASGWWRLWSRHEAAGSFGCTASIGIVNVFGEKNVLKILWFTCVGFLLCWLFVLVLFDSGFRWFSFLSFV